jgi:hypothetical protein
MCEKLRQAKATERRALGWSPPLLPYSVVQGSCVSEQQNVGLRDLELWTVGNPGLLHAGLCCVLARVLWSWGLLVRACNPFPSAVDAAA